MTTLYGIPNCDTMKKARVWLDEHAQPYTFHDYKKQGASDALLRGWLAQVDWAALLNRQGSTWRKFDAAVQAAVVDADSALALMSAHPSLIRRPVLVRDGQLLIGFKPEWYDAFFAGRTLA